MLLWAMERTPFASMQQCPKIHHQVAVLVAAAASAAARLVLASPDQLAGLAGLDAEPAILVNGPHGPWVAALRLR